MQWQTLAAARRTLFAGVLVAISLFGDSYLYAVLPVRAAEAGVSVASVGWLLSVNRWVRLGTNPLAGWVGARLGWTTAFAAAMWLATATTAGYGLLYGLAPLLVARALWGLSWSFLRLGGMAAVLAESNVGGRGPLMGLFTGVFRLGSLVAVVAGAYLADELGLGLRGGALVLGVATAAGAVVATLPGALSGRWGVPARETGATGAPATAHSPLDGLRATVALAPRQLAACLSAFALHLVTSGLVTATLGLLVKERLGSTVPVAGMVLGAATVTGWLLGARWILDLALGPALGHLADQRGRGFVLGATAIVVAGALLVLGFSRNLWVIAAAAAVLFSAGTGHQAAVDAWAGDLAGKTPGRFLPAYSTWLDLGAAAGPALAYPIIAAAGLGPTYAGGAAILLLVWGARALLTRDAGARTLPGRPA